MALDEIGLVETVGDPAGVNPIAGPRMSSGSFTFIGSAPGPGRWYLRAPTPVGDRAEKPIGSIS
jgi:hypothetical protein